MLFRAPAAVGLVQGCMLCADIVLGIRGLLERLQALLPRLLLDGPDHVRLAP